MVIIIKEIYICRRKLGKEFIDGIIVIIIIVIMVMIIEIGIMMVKFNIKGNSKKIILMDLLLLDSVMDNVIKGKLKMGDGMVKELINIVMGINLKVNGKMIKNKWENIILVQEINSKVSLNQDRWHLGL